MKSMQSRLIGRLAAVAAAGVACTAGAGTITVDPAKSSLDGVQIVNGQITLTTQGSTFPIMWVANAGEDTVSKVDTRDNKEIARYRTWFNGPVHGAWDGAAPSRTAVDTNGNVFVANRHFDGRPALLLKILASGGIDRNGNGQIDTSADTNGNGMIDAAEIKPITDTNGNGRIDPNELTDERVAWAVPVGGNGGLGRAVCIGTDGNVWVGLYSSMQFYKVSANNGAIMSGPHAVPFTPYGCAVDRNGKLWAATLSSQLGWLDTGSPTSTGSHDVSNTYGIAIGNGKVYLGSNSAYLEVDAANPANQLHRPGGSTAGLSTDINGDIVTGSNRAAKYSKANGALVWENASNPASYAVGVVSDGDGNVWQVDLYSNRVTKFRGSDGAYLGTVPVGASPYTYSDATGIAARTQTTQTGFITQVLDSGSPDTSWYKVCWLGEVPNGATATADSRAANTQAGLENVNYQQRVNCMPLLQQGQFLELRTKLQANLDGTSPALSQIVVQTRTCDVDKDNDIDSADLNLIRAALNTRASGVSDARDADGNGNINVLDIRSCTLQCTRARCATN